MNVEWNEKKAESNLKKHGVSFDEAVSALQDPLAVTFEDDGHYTEVRELTIGHSYRQRLILVVHTEREGETIRIISARQATKRERKQYEEGI
ncbi:MAG: BrnT family toxin [Deltaproteobacteria bacterium]|nr:BrnT family toxin [Deltaproteobacteria bacterium]